MDQLFEIDLELPSAGGRSLSESLCRQLRKAIEDGRLPAGARLPAGQREPCHLGARLQGQGRALGAQDDRSSQGQGNTSVASPDQATLPAGSR